MKKYMKKIVLLITLICVITMISKSYSSNISKDEYTSYLKRSEEMVLLSTKVENEMLKNNNEYPSYYGGMYIDDGAYNLVLQIVEDNIPNKEESQYSSYDKVIHMDNKIIIQYVKNKYSDLLDVYNEINNYYEEVNYDTTKREFNEFSSYYIDIKSNSVIVLFNNKLLIDNEKEIIQNNLEEKFKKNVVDSSVISFGFGNELVLETSNLNSKA